TKTPVYASNPASYKTFEANPDNGTENDWRIYSQGECLTGEFQLTHKTGVGNNETGRFYDAAEDLIGGPATTGVITFTGVKSGNPCSAGIESTKTFTAPFDVVTYVGNGASDGKPGSMEVQISKDGKEWTSVQELTLSTTQRYIKKNRVSVNEPGEYYVRLAHIKGGKQQVCDIYIMNNGEVSKTYDPSSSIEEIIAGNEAAEVVAVEVYNLNGYRLAKAEQGVNIIRTVYADGTVKVEKVIVK
ncbi:MAG: discoidin domain-containing protein, partial [Duncaniella sp.]|nr:discoidin domain-containing protein [Duncaniella sp.]